MAAENLTDEQAELLKQKSDIRSDWLLSLKPGDEVWCVCYILHKAVVTYVSDAKITVANSPINFPGKHFPLCKVNRQGDSRGSCSRNTGHSAIFAIDDFDSAVSYYNAHYPALAPIEISFKVGQP